MSVKLNISIARALLLARWKQTMVAAVGVTFSITMFIALLGFMTGLNILLDSLLMNRTPHVRLYREVRANPNQPVNLSSQYNRHYNFISSVKSGNSREQIYNSATIMQNIRRDDRVLGLAPKITSQVFFNEGNIDITGVVYGIDVEAEIRLFYFNDYVITGNTSDLKNVANTIILGKGLAEKLLADIGDIVQVTNAQGERFRLKVAGYYQSGVQSLDKTQSFASIQTVQKILGKPNNYITDILVKLKDVNQAAAIAGEYANNYETDAEDFKTANAQFETGSSARSVISYAVGITLLIVAGFGIYNILNMMIYDKMDSIAILKATGFSGKDVKLIFMVIALGIGLFGGALGLLFGFLVSLLLDQVPFHSSAAPAVNTYPINYNPVFYFIGAVFSLVTTYFAGFFPARKASKVDPVIIIRGK
ncbi:ABC transporter permease [Flavihumibacter stibioxidans]|uniref:ABC transporter n=1 Tax=Flavihumibacter stibioxidans TaxID=1834163 RepID=A0ABR7M640_9BACT|nr:FtsX-like permease family protein [Flavihumibacter stibioxidans]MBC6490505.1 ABC transporter [Flavihumibacter stibioxidans]